ADRLDSHGLSRPVRWGAMILLDQAGAGAGAARFFPPSRAQASFIEHFWIQQTGPTPAGRSWRIIPEANPYLIFVVSREDSRVRARCFLTGPRSRFADVTMGNLRLPQWSLRARPLAGISARAGSRLATLPGWQNRLHRRNSLDGRGPAMIATCRRTAPQRARSPPNSDRRPTRSFSSY